jgi:hypothetical protein
MATSSFGVLRIIIRLALYAIRNSGCELPHRPAAAAKVSTESEYIIGIVGIFAENRILAGVDQAVG